MIQEKITTRDRLISAALKLFYAEGIGAVTVDAIAAKAGVTKRTLYYHFSSKDDLIVAYLEAKDQPSRALMQRWFDETRGDIAAKTRGIFLNLAQSACHAKWKGCGFLRTSAELANLPGHPALKVGANHKKRFEGWLQQQYEQARIFDATRLARQVILLLDGSFSVVLLHKDPSYMETAGDAAYRLVTAALQTVDRTAEIEPIPLRSAS
ncbi:TetR/AcrR family transcriptional regulator [uncultured Bradyrhizobium sp.]|uniref:TetR/AcrR family transcriptional regulator n=1 Tax=uncultured Bradyrhizobium sp. TaxID=199684 RepID=UPI0035CAC537